MFFSLAGKDPYWGVFNFYPIIAEGIAVLIGPIVCGVFLKAASMRMADFIVMMMSMVRTLVSLGHIVCIITWFGSTGNSSVDWNFGQWAYAIWETLIAYSNVVFQIVSLYIASDALKHARHRLTTPPQN
jgi:hypothetical protein